jgi:transposase-like protein
MIQSISNIGTLPRNAPNGIQCLRTTNPIESTFATVRHRTIRSKGCLSNRTALAMVFRLVEGAQKNWRRLDGYSLLPKLILGVKFSNGLEVIATANQLQTATDAA